MFKKIVIASMSFLICMSGFAQTCEEELHSKSYVILSLKINAYLQAKTANRLNDHYNSLQDQLYKKYQNELESPELEDKYEAIVSERDRVMKDRVIIAYNDPAICDQKEPQDLIYAFIREKSKLCESNDRYKELDDLSEEVLSGDFQTCPKPSELNSYYQSSLPKDALLLSPKKTCLIVFEVMKKKVTECHNKAKKNAP